MLDQPKTLTVPGIDTPLREQTLAEYVLMIPDPNHLVRRELAELQRGYGEAITLRQENQKMRVELDQLRLAKSTVIQLSADSPVYKSVNCPLCSRPISTRPGTWYGHMKAKHELVKADPECPIPPI